MKKMKKMKKQCTLWATLMMVIAATGGGVRADLLEYVRRPDDSYKYQVHESFDFGRSTVYQIKLTSQTWRGLTWSHWLTKQVVPSSAKSQAPPSTLRLSKSRTR